MAIRNFLCFLIIAGTSLGYFGPQEFLEVDESAAIPRGLLVVPPEAKDHPVHRNHNIGRLAEAFRTIRGKNNKKTGRRGDSNRRLSIPAADLAFSLGQGVGKAVNWLPSKVKLPLANNPQEETSLGLGVASLGYGIMAGRAEQERFEDLHAALQNKYQMNGIYLASLEDENIQVRYCNKRLQKILDKSARHRKNMLAKLHLSINPN
jgi:hypothetical protein